MSGNPPATASSGAPEPASDTSELASDASELRASVVIPAHNEEKVILRCLESLAEQRHAGDIEVIVAANGCTDATVSVARSFARLPHLMVLDIPQPSKSGALNAGDDAAHAFPRIYLDADITLAPGALADLISVLDVPQPRIASPRIRFDLTASSPAVRRFFAVFTELPYVRTGLVGLGVYGMSEAGRARFERFPDITADDLFAQRIFQPSERVIVDSEFVVTAPRDLANLMKVRTRVARGNTELRGVADRPDEADFDSSTRATVAALLGLVRERPTRLPAAATYLGVTLGARWRARRTAASKTWDRDTSTR